MFSEHGHHFRESNGKCLEGNHESTRIEDSKCHRPKVLKVKVQSCVDTLGGKEMIKEQSILASMCIIKGPKSGSPEKHLSFLLRFVVMGEREGEGGGI